MLYTRTPKTIRAEQFRRSHPLPPGVCIGTGCLVQLRSTMSFPHVHTIHQEQVVVLEDGDWVVPERDGVHYYPIKDAEFRASYKPIDEEHVLTPEEIAQAQIFWTKLLKGKNLRQEVQKELMDYHFIIDQLPTVYMHVTGGTLSKHMYFASVVCSVADEHVDNTVRENMREELEQLLKHVDDSFSPGGTKENFLEHLRDRIEAFTD